MICRKVKLKLNSKNKKKLEKYFYQLTGCYNWALSECFARMRKGEGYSYFDILYLIKNHSKKSQIPLRTIQGTIKTAQRAVEEFQKGLGGKPRRKGVRNKLNSILFTGDVKISKDFVGFPGIGKIKYHSYDLPVAAMATEVRILKQASGYYAVLVFKENHSQEIEETTSSIGIDTGFKHLLVTSDGEKISNPRELEQSLKQLARVQRGQGKKKTAKLHEKIKNQRKDRNHKISHDLVKNYSEIYITIDNLKGQSKKFGKSIESSAIGELRNMIFYKSSSCGRKCSFVTSRFTTMTCNVCLGRTGPRGLSKLNVRFWECSACSAKHDRDVNAAINILKAGQRSCLESGLTTAVSASSGYVLEELSVACDGEGRPGRAAS